MKEIFNRMLDLRLIFNYCHCNVLYKYVGAKMIKSSGNLIFVGISKFINYVICLKIVS